METASVENNIVARIEILVRTIAANNEFKNFKLKTKAISSNGANFLGDLYLVDVIEEGKDALNLFVKASNMTDQVRMMVPVNEMYKTEAFVYTTVADAFNKLQERHLVPAEKRFLFPKYYGSNLNEKEEIIVLENLSTQGYDLHDRFKPIDWDYTKVAVEELAKYHALSFALEKEEPNVFENVIKNRQSPFKSLDSGMIQSIKASIPVSLSVVEPENYEKIKNYINDNAETIFLNNTYLAEPPKHSVLMHADYRMSNIMAKYQDRRVVSLKPIDYQTASFGSPVTDLLYFLFTGSDETFRRHHFEDFFLVYHNSLAAHLKLLSQDVNDIYPRSSFYFDLNDRLIYGLEVGLYMLNIVLDPSQVKTLSESLIEDSVDDEIKPSDAYVDRVNGIVRDFVRLGYFMD